MSMIIDYVVMVSIISTQSIPQRLAEVDSWFGRVWDEVDPLQGDCFPDPLVALDREGRLVGALAFTVAPIPKASDLAIWINVVLVSPNCRGRGIATRLVQAAEQAAWQLRIPKLYVFSDVPQLYEKSGWYRIRGEKYNKEPDTDAVEIVLTKSRPE
ncbi:MAG: GNAT family N-acetyltransferase [Pseudomonadales bacterium]|nr:GNAT family N-acetyltransferase [Pseudomonadales bacterium]